MTLANEFVAEQPRVECDAPVAAKAAAGRLRGRTFLIVTAPFGPFSRALAAELRGEGAEVRRVLANAGDLVDWGSAQAVRFQDVPEGWPAWIAGQVAEATDVILFGDSTAPAIAAVKAAEAAGVRLWVLENGYFRPDWITLELGGVNANSGLSRSPGAYAAELPRPPEATPVGTITPFHVGNTIRYFTAAVLGGALFPRWTYPYAVPLLPQTAGHIRRYLAGLFAGARADRQVERILARTEPFFLALLQREGDSQLVRHSDLGTNAAFIERVVGSFAERAPAEARLVVKNHPLDPGVDDLGAVVRATARRFGVEDRVEYLDGGQMAGLAHAAAGVVAVNSTGALAAAGFGTPVKLLGRAFFDMPGLTDPQPLDDFWPAPARPDPELFHRFRRHVTWKTQVNGSFHNPAFLPTTCRNLVMALLAREMVREPPLEAYASAS